MKPNVLSLLQWKMLSNRRTLTNELDVILFGVILGFDKLYESPSLIQEKFELSDEFMKAIKDFHEEYNEIRESIGKKKNSFWYKLTNKIKQILEYIE